MLKRFAWIIVAATGASAASAQTAEPGYVLVAFAGDSQIGFIAPATITHDAASRRFTTLWVYTPPAAIGPHLVHRAERRSRADCARGRIGEEEALFYGDGPAPLFAESRREPAMRTVLPDSAGRDVLDFVCSGKEPYPDIKISQGAEEAAALAAEIGGFYRANPTR